MTAPPPTELDARGRRLRAALAAMLALAGCASGARLATFEIPREQVAYVTVFRPSTIGAGSTIPLLVDDRPVVELGAREYATVEIPAGAHVAAIPTGVSGGGALGLFRSGFNFVEFKAAPGEHIYILMDHSFFDVDPRLYPAQPAPAMLEKLRKIE